jgi:hypothetical protein
MKRCNPIITRSPKGYLGQRGGTMKTSVAFIIILLLIVGISLPVLAIDGEYQNASQWCTANDDLDYGNHGQCVKSVMGYYTSGGTGALYACKDLHANNPKGFYDEYNNLNECISHLRHGFVDNN